MGKIKNIVFDFGGVLLEWNPRYLYRSYFNDDEKMEWFLSNVCTLEWNARFDEGKPFAEGIRELKEKWPEWAEAIQIYLDKWPVMLDHEYPESIEMLKRLKSLGYGIYGLTNWSAETIGVAYANYDFFKLFEGIVVSGEEKLLKPDPRIYKVLLERYGLQAEESVFIDDNAANVEAARGLGFHGIHFDNIANVKAQVDALIEQN